MMGIDVLEPLPSRNIPYSEVDPFILVHEATVPITAEWASKDTEHPHRGFDNLWYVLEGSASTGHSTGPGGTMERARLNAGSLLKIRTGRGVVHAEALGEDEVREGKTGQMHSVLFWVNLARKDKGAEPTAQVLESKDVPVRQEGDATVRVLVGEGSPVELGTPGVILDVELPKGGSFTTQIPSDFKGFAYMLEGEAHLCSSRRQRVDRGGCDPRYALLADGRQAVRRKARLQRTVRGLTLACDAVAYVLVDGTGRRAKIGTNAHPIPTRPISVSAR
jgi:redox-sensitive bicupin YhaK (pirin superfamily)